MTDLNSQYDYYQQINAIARELVSEAMEQSENDREQAEELINDTLLHETIDGHEWVIYYAYNLDVIKYSDNEDYMEQNFGNEEAGTILAEKGLNGLHTAIAFWCMYADVQERLETAFNEFEDNLDSEE